MHFFNWFQQPSGPKAELENSPFLSVKGFYNWFIMDGGSSAGVSPLRACQVWAGVWGLSASLV
jgi:hypothetical protein